LRFVECRVWEMMGCSVFGSVDIYYLSFRCRYVCLRPRELLSHRSTHTFAGSPKLILSYYDSFVHLSSVSSYTAHLGGKLWFFDVLINISVCEVQFGRYTIESKHRIGLGTFETRISIKKGQVYYICFLYLAAFSHFSVRSLNSYPTTNPHPSTKMDNSTPIPPDAQAVSYHPSANSITLPLFSILISLLLITPFRLLLRVHNIPTTSLIGVIWLSLLFITINSLIWPTEDLSNRFSGHILCDIEVLLRQALYTTMASTTCCITKFLASALDTDNACLYESRAMKRRRVLKDCLFCFAVPVCQVGLHYLVQLNRYTVLTVYGCVDSMDPSWVSVVVFHVWPPIFALLNFYYAGMSFPFCSISLFISNYTTTTSKPANSRPLVLVIRRLHQHRTNLSSTLSRSSSTTSLSPRRFLKLFLMSLTLLIIYFPILIYYFYLNVSYPFHAYSFSYIHDPLYWPIIVFWQTADAPSGMQYDAWCWVAMGFLVCCFWGWNEEAKELWRGWLVKLGLGRCWPRLRLSARERRECAGSASGGRSRGTLGSWVDSLDLLGRTLSYFENKEVVKKASFTTSTTLDAGEM
jgi:pheromone a factor receptor